MFDTRLFSLTKKKVHVMRFAHPAALWFSLGNCAEFVQTMATRDYLRDQDAEEPEEFIVALTSQVFF